jgi:hypothetical protein
MVAGLAILDNLWISARKRGEPTSGIQKRPLFKFHQDIF